MMKVILPHGGERDICGDDSCDGSHCKSCGCHFAEWNHQGRYCTLCDETLTPEQQLENSQAIAGAMLIKILQENDGVYAEGDARGHTIKNVVVDMMTGERIQFEE